MSLRAVSDVWNMTGALDMACPTTARAVTITMYNKAHKAEVNLGLLH